MIASHVLFTRRNLPETDEEFGSEFDGMLVDVIVLPVRNDMLQTAATPHGIVMHRQQFMAIPLSDITWDGWA